MPQFSITAADGHALTAHVDGDESPTIVLLHAGVCDVRSWEGVVDDLAPRNRVVRYDRRGFGSCAPSAGDFSHLDDLLAVLDEVAPDEPVWLVGSSMGGSLAINAALEHPDRVAGLVLFAPGITGQPWGGFDEMDPATRTLELRAMHAAEAGDLDEQVTAQVELWLDGPAAPGRVIGPVRDLATDMARVIAEGRADEDAGSTGVVAWPRLDELELPVTVIWGTLDAPDQLPGLQHLCATVPQGRLIEFPGTAHLPYLEHPLACAELMLEAVHHLAPVTQHHMPQAVYDAD
ncbi:MAG: alpha/beta hydrolase fold [Thermoleophilia bacterium]|nr:alpha/beta hydrolase fold [Thermoleophilia bacterium]